MIKWEQSIISWQTKTLKRSKEKKQKNSKKNRKKQWKKLKGKLKNSFQKVVGDLSASVLKGMLKSCSSNKSSYRRKMSKIKRIRKRDKKQYLKSRKKRQRKLENGNWLRTIFLSHRDKRSCKGKSKLYKHKTALRQNFKTKISITCPVLGTLMKPKILKFLINHHLMA